MYLKYGLGDKVRFIDNDQFSETEGSLLIGEIVHVVEDEDDTHPYEVKCKNKGEVDYVWLTVHDIFINPDVDDLNAF